MPAVVPRRSVGRLQRRLNRAIRFLAAILAGDGGATLKFWHSIWGSLPLTQYEQWRPRSGPLPAAGQIATCVFSSLDCADFPADLAAIKSDLVYVLAAGDRPAPDAVSRLAALFDQDRSLALAFSDHDRRDSAGKLFPVFKPGWDPELQANGDYLGPGVMLRRSALPAGVMTFKDLLLSWAPSLRAEAVRHLPLPLIESGGNWPSILEKPVAPRKATEPPLWPLVSIIVPTHDQRALLEVCLDGVLHKTDYPSIEIILVDNGSCETETLSYIEGIQADARVRVLRDPGAFNFSRLNNRAAEIAKGDVLVLLNNDTQVIEPGWLKALIAEAIRPEVGVVGALLLYPDGSIQHAGVSTGTGGNVWHLFAQQEADRHALACYPRQVAAVTGACLAIRRQLYRGLGGLDEGFPVTFNDVDFCLRVQKKGLRVIYAPTVRLIHHESKTRGLDVSFAKQLDNARARRRLRRLHGRACESDPFFNPNLAPGLGEPRLVRRRP